MSAAPHPLRLDLAGLETRPSQVWGGIRLVPLVRTAPLDGLRLHEQVYGEGYGVVSNGPRTRYVSYIPHGFVAEWGADAGHCGPAAAYGTQLRAPGGDPRRPDPVECVPVRSHRRMVVREAKRRLRFLPLHLALEGYLSLHFGGPSIAWEEWSRQALRRGLSPRVEEAYAGAEVRGLGDALKVFEIHPDQCGVLVYTADALAAAFVVPHRDDYRALHPTLVLDLFGELVYQYGLLSAGVPDFTARLGDGARTLPELRAAADAATLAWAGFHDDVMAGGLLKGEYTARTVYRAGDFTLSRFLPAFRLREENHLGETITAADGRVAYLKTFRLSEAQVRRGHLLSRLAANEWRLAAAADELNLTPAELALRLSASGFRHLLRQPLRDR